MKDFTINRSFNNTALADLLEQIATELRENNLTYIRGGLLLDRNNGKLSIDSDIVFGVKACTKFSKLL